MAVVLEAAGLESDGTLKDYDTLAAILAAANNEQTDMGRKALTRVMVTTDDMGDRVVINCDDIAWSAATGDPCVAVVICYDPDTTGGTDSDLIPLAVFELAATPAGGTITLQVNAGGLLRAS